MKRIKNISIQLFLVIIITVFASAYTYSQITSNMRTTALEASFINEKTETNLSKTIFNVLRVKNISTKPVSFTVKFTVPDKWSLIGLNNQSYSLAVGEEIKLPIRIAPDNNSKGAVGYAISADLISNDTKKKIISAFCYIRVTEKVDLRYKPVSRIEYFDVKTGKATFSFKLENKGNRDELVNIQLAAHKSIIIPQAEKGVLFTDVLVPPHQDTIIEFTIYRNDEEFNGYQMQYLDIKASTQDTTFQSSVWFKNVKNIFTNQISSSNKVLVVNTSLQNLMGSSLPTLSAEIYGATMLKNNHDVYYYYRNMSNQVVYDFYKYSWFYAGYRGKKYDICLGDQGVAFEQQLTGKGLNAKIFLGENTKHTIQAVATRYPIVPINNFGLSYDIRINPKLMLGTAGAFTRREREKLDEKLGLISYDIRYLRNHYFSGLFALSDTRHFKFTPFNKLGYGYTFNYVGNVKKLRLTINNKFGSREYTGGYRGRFDLIGMAYYEISQTMHAYLQYINNYYSPATYYNDTLEAKRYFNYELYNLQYGLNIAPRVFLYTGPQIENQRSNDLFRFENSDIFATTTGKWSASLRIRGENYNTYVMPTITFGFTTVTKFAPVIDTAKDANIYTNKPAYINSSFSLNFRNKWWGVRLLYYYGPYNIAQQYSYFYFDVNYKSLRIMPFFEKYLIKDKLKLASYSSYTNDITSSSQRINLNLQLYYYFTKGWTLHAYNTLYFYNRYDQKTLSYVSSQDNYLEVGLNKEFDFQQPRMKYADLKIVFFKDINGNRTKEEDEPGIRNVLVSIERDQINNIAPINSSDNSSYFIPVELLTDQYGMITYNNIPSGNYNIKYLLLDKVSGYYSSDNNKLNYSVDKDVTLFIPFFVSNKIYGHININRDQFSILGKIDISNIKVSAIDSLGNTYSTLTNKNGEFVLFTPNSGYFKVTINNILGEHFDCVQEEFVINFDGYKQYEVVFVFNEKPRQISYKSEQIAPFNNENMVIPENQRKKSQPVENGKSSDINIIQQSDPSLLNKNTKKEEKAPTQQKELKEAKDLIKAEFNLFKPELDTQEVIAFIERVLDLYQTAVTKVTDPGLVFKVQLFSSKTNMSSSPTIENVSNAESKELEGVICIKDENGDFLYLSRSFKTYAEARAHRDKMIEMFFENAIVVAFKDGKKITLKEAGVNEE